MDKPHLNKPTDSPATLSAKTPNSFTRRPNPERLGLGLIVVAVGVVFLLDNLKLLSLSAALPFWPVILVALGALKLAYARQTGGGVWGVVLMGAGGVLLASHFGWLEVSWRALWPLIVVGVGLSIVIKAMRPGKPSPSGQVASRLITDDMIDLSLLMSGSESRVHTEAFKGGRVNLMLSGAELDLRDAKLQGSARLAVDVMLGGLELRVPPTWQVVVKSAQFMGAVENRTVPSIDSAGPQLILEGRVFMGGVEVRN
jgi:hypothetical protein